MLQLAQSSFLQALGYAIVNSLWQFALLCLVYLIITTLLKFTSHQKYAAAVVMQFAGFSWFMVTFVFYFSQVESLVASGDVFYYNYDLISAGGTIRNNLYSLIIRTEQFLPFLSIAYLSLLFFLSVKWLQCYNKTQQIRNTGIIKIDVEWKLFVRQIASQMGVKVPVAVYLSSLVKSPVTIGFLKPIILIPLASLNNLSVEQMEAVLLHEIAHIKRFDYLTNMLLSVIESLLFFNPFMQILSRCIKRERENSCDDWVLQYNYNATNYAKALLQIALQQNGISTAFGMKAVEDKQALLQRVKRMIEKKEKTSYSHRLIAFLLITIVLSSLSWLSLKSNSKIESTKRENVVFQPLAAKIENPLFNPVFFLAEKETPVEIGELVANGPTEKKSEIKLTKILLPIEKAKVSIQDELTPHVVVRENPSLPLVSAVVRNFEKKIDTLRFNTTYHAVLGQQFWTSVDVAAKELKKVTASESKKLIDHEALVKEMQLALQNLRSNKIQLLQEKYAATAKTHKEAKELGRETLKLIAKSKTLKTPETRGISEQLQQEMEDLQNEFAILTTLNAIEEQTNYAFHPATINKTASHSYSYDYQPKLTAQPLILATNGSTSRKSTVNVSTNCNNETFDTPRPQSTERPKRTVIKRIKI